MTGAAGLEHFALETEAGIRDAAVRAHEGPFIPIELTNPDMPRDTQRDWNYDDRREKLRHLYFGVARDALRKALPNCQINR